MTAQPSSQSGVTLIELLIVVVVIGILAAIALPSYQEHVRRSARGEAKTVLTEIAGIMERNYSGNGCYHRADGNCGNATTTVTVPFSQSPKTGTARYNISFATLTAQTFTVQAVPTGAQVGDACGTLSLTQAGQMSVTGSTVEECWNR